MKRINSALRLPDTRITASGRFDGGDVTNTVALSIETKAASFPPRANGRKGHDDR